jgi:hypothetical protein
MTTGNRPDISLVKGYVLPVRPDAQIQEIGTNGFMIRTEVIDQAQKDTLLQVLTVDGNTAPKNQINQKQPPKKHKANNNSKNPFMVSSALLLSTLSFACQYHLDF